MIDNIDIMMSHLLVKNDKGREKGYEDQNKDNLTGTI